MIGVIENAIIARLKAADTAGVLGYHWADVDSLPIEIDEQLPEWITRFPSAWTVFGGWRPIAQTTQGERVRATFHLVVGAQNLRNERATRMGGTDTEVGSYQLAMDAAGLLVGQDLGLPIQAFTLGVLTPLYTKVSDKGRRISLMALELPCEFVVEPIGAAQPNIGDFATFHTDWDIPPFGGVGPALPDEAHADASDTLSLET